MGLPIKTANFSCQDTSYRIKTKDISYRLPCQMNNFGCGFCRGRQKDSYILKNVNCEAGPGEITAIAGPSGAGKTTLLDILAGMIPLSKVCGHVLVNEMEMNAKHFRRISGYVIQEDDLFPLLTVEETLMFSARLRLFGEINKVKARVREIIKELGLEHVANVRVGDASSRGISGGEKRGVLIGVELVHDPAVLLLDEPTSGLDSTSALQVALLLKAMATNQGKTIVLTIHQPGFRILELFDQILLLAKGNVLHQGSLDLLEQRLRQSGHSIPRHVNVVEFAIEITEALKVDTEEETEVENNKKTKPNPGNLEEHSNNPIFINTIANEILILSQRFCINVFRTKQLFFSRTIQAMLIGFVLGTIFTNSPDSKNLKLQTQLGFFAFTVAFLMSASTEGLPIYLQQRRILMRETSRGAYRVCSYVIADTLVFLPFLLTVALLYAIPVYWLVGLKREILGFLYFSLVAWIVVLMANSVIACFSALVPNFVIGTSLVGTVVGSSFLFSGYFISREEIPKYWIFMHYLSLFKYPFECFVINEYGGEGEKRRCLIKEEGICILYGYEFLRNRGLRESQKWSHLGIMLSFVLGYRVLCFLVLWYRSRTARK
ncbi:ABC transporter G family member 10-like [Momordica charantia]|uniref:ABC transporter G family member 10-like n=1 Tax=Momordica charantia TaxID=3673 RepID=A0A6J1D3L2_MOMCH|nr:ABC transporter G family member 10-like [Momordica charantia]